MFLERRKLRVVASDLVIFISSNRGGVIERAFILMFVSSGQRVGGYRDGASPTSTRSVQLRHSVPLCFGGVFRSVSFL